MKKIEQLAQIRFQDFGIPTYVGAAGKRVEMIARITFLELIDALANLYVALNGATVGGITATFTNKATGVKWDDGSKYDLCEWG